ncbi:hypothetical protein JMJ35_003660 [Cladonia borealis]|uniref:Uncharacterized protein n=1 Tax=Cladonia borealis TaxID=184061 RepID=A0AA39R5Y9_9LECA|nr:hypothetical protein JMJ35_003660 [Cladonia borealis]
MACFGRAIASGVTNVVEFSPSLVNLNFNFALHQVEAPVEFQGVGKTLSHIRRREAEAGRPHVTARILGALFSSLVAETPKLFSLYGLRASEISGSPTINPSEVQNYGFFSSRVGADATTVWAGATSGPGAIAVHLLACMLARVWDPSEATSIWMEIVKERSGNILNEFEGGRPVDFRDVAAAKNALTRPQLAEWDASARAWLHAADRVKAREEKQLMLILDNIRQYIDSARGTFSSVMEAWQKSLTVFEALLNGVSQKEKRGETFLALSAWHLYPDLMVLQPFPQTIKQKDPLLHSSGILTVGLHQIGEEQGGIRWSLPLAQLRHYGGPVNRERTVNSTQRLTLEEFSQVFLGAFLHGWGDIGTETFAMIRWVKNVHRALLTLAEQKLKSMSENLRSNVMACWLDLLFKGCETCLQACKTGDGSPKQLLRLGRRYAEVFLGEPPSTWPYFGLSTGGAFVSCAGTEDDRIQILREAAASLPHQPSQMFIRVRHELAGVATPLYEYATAKPMARDSSKRRNDGSLQPIHAHRRWIYGGSKVRAHTNDNEYYRRLITVFPEIVRGSGVSSPAVVETNEQMDTLSKCSAFISKDDDRTLLPVVEANFRERSKRYYEQGEDVFQRETCTVEDFEAEKMGIFWPDHATEERKKGIPWYNQIYGDDTAAIFANVPAEHAGGSVHAADDFPLTHFHTFFESHLLDPSALGDALYRKFSSVDETLDYRKSLRAVSAAASLYKDLGIATIDVRVLERRLWDSPWIPIATSENMARYRLEAQQRTSAKFGSSALNASKILFSRPLNLASAFSCICFSESGRFQVQPKNLRNVMAMCSNDLIWVASYLLEDPSKSEGKIGIRVFPGNIGRSSIAFLLPPMNPMRRPNSIHGFRDIVHRPFDGHLQNNFRTTSLHLSFTTAESPLGDNFSGMQDDELYLLETLLSVHEGGDWVADLDILGSFSSRKYARFGPCDKQNIHTRSKNHPEKEISCVDNWAELLEPPEVCSGIVRASGDWEARLATFSVAVSTVDRVFVLPDSICWDCIDDELASFDKHKKAILIA